MQRVTNIESDVEELKMFTREVHEMKVILARVEQQMKDLHDLHIKELSGGR